MIKKERLTVRDPFLINIDLLVILSQQPGSISQIGTKANLTWERAKMKVESLMGFGLVEKYTEESSRDSRVLEKFRNTQKGTDMLELIQLTHKNAPTQTQISIPNKRE